MKLSHNNSINNDEDSKSNMFGQKNINENNYSASILFYLRTDITKLETTIEQFKHHLHLQRIAIAKISSRLTSALDSGPKIKLLSQETQGAINMFF